MLDDVRAVMWKEARELARQRSTFISALVLLAMFGILFPAQEGAAHLRAPVSLMGFAVLPFATIVPFIADAFAGERERHTLESLLATRLPDRAILAGKISTAVAFGWGLVVAESILAFATVNLAPHPGGLQLYDPVVLVGGLVLGLLVALLVATLGVLVSLRAATVKQAQQILAMSIALVALAIVAGGALLPSAILAPLASAAVRAGPARVVAVGLALLALVDAILLAAAAWRFRRARLILE